MLLDEDQLLGVVDEVIAGAPPFFVLEINNPHTLSCFMVPIDFVHATFGRRNQYLFLINDFLINEEVPVRYISSLNIINWMNYVILMGIEVGQVCIFYYLGDHRLMVHNVGHQAPPAVAVGVQPGDEAVGVQPGDEAVGDQPGDEAVGDQPGDEAVGVQPGDEAVGDQPGDDDYYDLSMEYLQGRALLNGVGNLELTGAYAETLKKLGHSLENVAGQEPDAALGDGGLGRLASCFLDSIATLNYPAWGYGIRYRYGLFKQLITKDGQEEVAENWLEVRILIDVKGLSWKEAWDITQRTVSYTNHTVLPEALEKWSLDLLQELLPRWRNVSLDLLQELLPRHVEIIRLIDEEFISTIIEEYGCEDLELLKEKLKQMRILDNIELPSTVLDSITESHESFVKQSIKEEEEEANEEKEEEEEETEDPESSEVTSATSEEKVKKPNDEDEEAEKPEPELVKVEKKVKIMFKPDPKQPKLVRMANLCVVGGHAVNGVAEIHTEIVKEEVFNEFYKLWPQNFQNKTNGVTPRRWIAFCNPELSKIITKWTGSADWLTNTEKLVELWKVVFVLDQNVSVAVLIPGTELSQHISTAGMEASGTSNMKFAMNGCIQIGTLDGANVEIRQEVDFFLFGGLREERAKGKFVTDPRFEEVKAYVRSGVFGAYNYGELMGSLEGNEGYDRADYFLVGKDFPSYIECQERVDEAYRDQKVCYKW